MSIVDFSTAVTASSSAIIVTSSATQHVQGAWVEGIASTSEETYWLQLILMEHSTDANFVINIGVGGSGSEVVKISFPVFMNTQGSKALVLPAFPVTIPSGSRVAVQCQASQSSHSVKFMMYLSNDSTFGTSTQNFSVGQVNSQGVDVDPTIVDNTLGAYAELTASTSFDANYWVFFMGNSDNGGLSQIDFLVNIATGAAASEVVQIPNIPHTASNTEVNATAFGFFHTIPASTRVSCNGQGDNVSGSATSDRIFDVAAIGFKLDAPAGGGLLRMGGMNGGMNA